MELTISKLKFFQNEDEPKVNLTNIILYVNSICNSTCMMCDIGQKNRRGIDILRMSNKNTFLDINLLKRLLEDPYIRDRKLSFSIVMTEPLLSPNIHEIVALIKSYGHHTHIVTNGFLLPKKAKDLIDAGLDSIQISLDGPREIHNKIRGGSFYERAVEGAKIKWFRNELKKVNHCFPFCTRCCGVMKFYYGQVRLNKWEYTG